MSDNRVPTDPFAIQEGLSLHDISENNKRLRNQIRPEMESEEEKAERRRNKYLRYELEQATADANS